MKKIGLFTLLFASANLFGATNAPIQRIDVANMLWNGATAVTQTPVIVSFHNGNLTPCATTTLAFQSQITVWAGTGQACVAPVTSITITVLTTPSGVGIVYDTPTPITISSGHYTTQMIIGQNTGPVFDGGNGAILATGTVQTTLLSFWDRTA